MKASGRWLAGQAARASMASSTRPENLLQPGG
jgi:hypothetical protein